MIISASRRTDIPAYYADWLLRRLADGYALVRNPRNPGRLGRVELSPDKVDCLALWTKNPLPMLDRLPELNKFGSPYGFQFTLTPYGRELEPALPDKPDLISAFQDLSRRLGKHRMVWRYDPIILGEGFTIEWQLERFRAYCEALAPHAQRCIFSFLDPYRKLKGRFRALLPEEMETLGAGMAEIAGEYGLPLFTCCEEVDLERCGIRHGACIDQSWMEEIIGAPIKAKRDSGQRPTCHCIESVDIGCYDTCPAGCAYCYATSGKEAVARRVREHSPDSPLLDGWPRGDELITDRTKPSGKLGQLTFFE